MTAVSKNVYIDEQDDIVNKYNNTYYDTIKIKPIDIALNSYIDCIVDHSGKKPEYKVGDYVRTSKY